jgi:3-oxoacyl-[acyl-carrier-protein] synthase-3
MSDLRILGTGSFVPGEPISNERLEQVFAIRADWIDYMIGTKSRHMVIDLNDKTVRWTLSDLCTGAARNAITASGLSPQEIDLVVLSTATPDYLVPATVNLVADAVGINGVRTIQIQGGCSGAIQAIETASSFIKAGVARNALVVSGDACYRYIDFTRDFKKAPASELVNLAIFGEGAGAAVLSAEPGSGGLSILNIFNRFEGGGRQPGHIMRWFGPTSTCADTTTGPGGNAGVWEDYKAVEAAVPRMATEALADVLSGIGKTTADIDYLLPPQLGGHMTSRIVKHLGVNTDKTVSCVADVGNCGNAMPLMQLDLLFPRLGVGELAVAIAIESSKWLKTGIAVTKN